MKATNTLVIIVVLVILAALFTPLLVANAMAIPSGKTLDWDSPQGKVTFDGMVHANKGLQCADCHTKPAIFNMEKSSVTMKMADINSGKFCGECQHLP